MFELFEIMARLNLRLRTIQYPRHWKFVLSIAGDDLGPTWSFSVETEEEFLEVIRDGLAEFESRFPCEEIIMSYDIVHQQSVYSCGDRVVRVGHAMGYDPIIRPIAKQLFDDSKDHVCTGADAVHMFDRLFSRMKELYENTIA